MPRVLLLFVDGVGLGDDDPAVNPFVTARIPTFTELSGGPPTLSSAPRYGTVASLIAVDAIMGGAGTPQSGTGQAALFTGRDAVALHGRHFGPWVPSRLQSLVREESVLARAVDAGLDVAFANAYPEEVTDVARRGTLPSDAPVQGGRARRAPSFLRAGPPLAALGAGLLTRHAAELQRGDAVASELTNDGWRERLGRTDVPSIEARDAGANLARIAGRHDLTLFAHYTTDYAGHQQDMAAAVAALEKLDAFLAGLLAAAAPDLLVVLVSDHGNIEDVRTGHTRNPAIGLVIGAGHEAVARRLHSLLDVTPVILDTLKESTSRGAEVRHRPG
jgi:hypothetical protein